MHRSRSPYSLQWKRTLCFQGMIGVVLRWLLSYTLSIHFHILLCLSFHISREWRTNNCFPGSLLVLEVTEVLPVRCSVQNLGDRGRGKLTPVFWQTGVFTTPRHWSCVFRFGAAVTLASFRTTSWPQDSSWDAVIWMLGVLTLTFTSTLPALPVIL